MKKIIFLLFFLQVLAFAQWIWQNPLPQGNSLYSVDFINSNTGWAVGRNGTILKTTNGGITFTEDEKKNIVTRTYSLSQNYPNPFNPTTVIEYEIPINPTLIKGKRGARGFVTLKIYDMLGRERETLVNKEQLAGKYSVEWNGSKYSSGIYFHELRAGDFRSIKNMMLVK